MYDTTYSRNLFKQRLKGLEKANLDNRRSNDQEFQITSQKERLEIPSSTSLSYRSLAKKKNRFPHLLMTRFVFIPRRFVFRKEEKRDKGLKGVRKRTKRQNEEVVHQRGIYSVVLYFLLHSLASRRSRRVRATLPGSVNKAFAFFSFHLLRAPHNATAVHLNDFKLHLEKIHLRHLLNFSTNF